MQEIFYRWLKVNGILFGVLFVVGGGALFFLRGDMQSRIDALVEERTLLASRSQGIAALAVLREESRRGAGYLGQLNEMLPKKDELFNFSRAVDAAARSRKVSFNFAFGAEASGSGSTPPSIGFTINTTGGYAEIMNFVRDLETQKFLVNFSSFDIVQAAANTYDARILGQVFFRQ